MRSLRLSIPMHQPAKPAPRTRVVAKRESFYSENAWLAVGGPGTRLCAHLFISHFIRHTLPLPAVPSPPSCPTYSNECVGSFWSHHSLFLAAHSLLLLLFSPVKKKNQRKLKKRGEHPQQDHHHGNPSGPTKHATPSGKIGQMKYAINKRPYIMYRRARRQPNCAHYQPNWSANPCQLPKPKSLN